MVPQSGFPSPWPPDLGGCVVLRHMAQSLLVISQGWPWGWFQIVREKGWNPILAPSLTFETRDDIFTLNKPKLFVLVENPPVSLGSTFVDLCLVSITISGLLSAPDVLFLSCLLSASVFAPDFPQSLCEDALPFLLADTDVPSCRPLTCTAGLLCAVKGPRGGPRPPLATNKVTEIERKLLETLKHSIV